YGDGEITTAEFERIVQQTLKVHVIDESATDETDNFLKEVRSEKKNDAKMKKNSKNYRQTWPLTLTFFDQKAAMANTYESQKVKSKNKNHLVPLTPLPSA